MASYIAPDFRPTSAVSLFGNVPRFGHTDDLTLLLTDENYYKDYAVGTSFIAITILVIFVLWLVLLCVFKFLGKRVGLLSGQRLKDERPHWFVRTLVMLSAAFALAAGSLYLMKATSSLYDTFGSIRNTAHDLSSLALDITQIADDLIEAGNATMPIRDHLVGMIDDGVCSSFDGGNGDQLDVDTEVEKAVEVLTDLSDFTNTELKNIKENFSTQFETIESEVNRYLDTAEDYSKISYYAIGIISLSSFLYIGAYLAWFAPSLCTLKVYFCFQTWVVLPLYFLTLIATTIFTAAIGTALVVNSDLCTSGEAHDPESLIKAVLDTQQLDPLARESIDHFVLTGCVSEFSGSQELDFLVISLEEGMTVCRDLKEIIQADITTFERSCGGSEGSLSPVLTALDVTKLAIGAFASIGYDAQNLLACKGLNEIYLSLFHGSVCSYMPETLAWMFCTMCIILLSGMMLFTLRAALLPNKIMTESSDSSIDDVEDIKYAPSNETPMPDEDKYDGIDLSVAGDEERNEYSMGLSVPSSSVIDEAQHENSTADCSDNQDDLDKSISTFGHKEETNDIEESYDDIEISRLPTNDSGDVDIQMSTRSLPVPRNESSVNVDEQVSSRSLRL